MNSRINSNIQILRGQIWIRLRSRRRHNNWIWAISLDQKSVGWLSLRVFRNLLLRLHLCIVVVIRSIIKQILHWVLTLQDRVSHFFLLHGHLNWVNLVAGLIMLRSPRSRSPLSLQVLVGRGVLRASRFSMIRIVHHLQLLVLSFLMIVLKLGRLRPNCICKVIVKGFVRVFSFTKVINWLLFERIECLFVRLVGFSLTRSSWCSCRSHKAILIIGKINLLSIVVGSTQITQVCHVRVWHVRNSWQRHILQMGRWKIGSLRLLRQVDSVSLSVLVLLDLISLLDLLIVVLKLVIGISTAS